MFINYLIIGLGGAFGAMARAFLAKMLPNTLLGIPIPILLINILGCFFIGVLTKIFSEYSLDGETLKLFLTTGFLGGFTTFSTFALEFGVLVEKNLFVLASAYVLASVVLSLTAFFVGLRV